MHRFLNLFSQLPAVKKDSKNGAARKFFGPSYFDLALEKSYKKKPIINVAFFRLLCCRCDPVCRCVGLTFNTFKRSVAVQDVDYNNGSCCPSIVGNKMTSAVCDDIYNLSEQQQQCYPPVSLEQNYPSVAIEQHQQWDPSVASNGQPAEPDSDAEDDPGKLLNAWLGQLNKVNLAQ